MRCRLARAQVGVLISLCVLIVHAERVSAGPVQWTTAAGGNGHWYEVVSAPGGISWNDAQADAHARGGYLATVTSAAENNFVFSLVDSQTYWRFWPDYNANGGPWLGGYQPAGSPEPGGGWIWEHDEGAFAFTNWHSGEPNNGGSFPETESRLEFFEYGLTPSSFWNDLPETPFCHVGCPVAYVIEYDTAPASGAQFSAAGSFSITNGNPNGPWVYGWTPTPGGSFTPMSVTTPTLQGVAGIPAWMGYLSAFGNLYPNVSKNVTADPIYMSGAIEYLPGQLMLHPANDGALSVVRFVAPFTGSAAVNAVFEGRDQRTTTTDVHVLLNGTPLFDGAISGFGAATDQAFSRTLFFSAGDTLDFAVGYGSNGDFLNDSTSLSAAISIPQIALTVTAPNGGEKIYTGTPYTITWTAGSQAVDHFDVEVSTDDGGSWAPVPGCSALSGSTRSCVWNVPGPVASKARIRVIATDAAAGTTSDASDNAFKILSGAATVTVSVPNSGSTNWAIGSHQQIAWKHNVGTASLFTIELSRDGGVTYPETLAAAVPATTAGGGVFEWQVTGPSTTMARLRVTWVSGPSASDASNTNFTVAPAFITVSSPKKGANWGYDTSQKIAWKTNLGPSDMVSVMLSTDGGITFPATLASGLSAAAAQSMATTPTLGAPATAARVALVWTNPPAGFSASGLNPGNFKIGPAFITVKAPKGGESWVDGSKQTIAWTSNLGALENVKIELSQDHGVTYAISVAASTASDGKEAVTVPASWNSSAARIRITWLKDAAVADASKADFTISGSAAASRDRP